MFFWNVKKTKNTYFRTLVATQQPLRSTLFVSLLTSERDKWKRNVLRRCLNISSDGADFTCDGRLFQKLQPETGKARLTTVERLIGLNGGTASWLKEADRSGMDWVSAATAHDTGKACRYTCALHLKARKVIVMAARQLAGRRPLYFTADVSILLLYFFFAG